MTLLSLDDAAGRPPIGVRPPLWASIDLSVRGGPSALLAAGLLVAGCGGPASPTPGPGALPVTGPTAAGGSYRVSVEPSLEPLVPGGRPTPAWCPLVELTYPGGGRTHGAVGCRAIRPGVPTGGYTMFCRSGDVFVLLLTTPTTRAVSVESAPGRVLALRPYLLDAGPGFSGRFWMAHYRGRSSPTRVASVDAGGRHVQGYAAVGCLGAAGANGLLGR
ncbi:MAG: hypothetical protein QOE44_526 [Solirubrobacteraceae bacterium]|nr:hypothetical protein [Solirubrobacteraceae bacterium]